jgi:hypothetical protein
MTTDSWPKPKPSRGGIACHSSTPLKTTTPTPANEQDWDNSTQSLAARLTTRFAPDRTPPEDSG